MVRTSAMKKVSNEVKYVPMAKNVTSQPNLGVVVGGSGYRLPGQGAYQEGSGPIVDLLLKVAPHLLSPIAEAAGKRISKFVSGDGLNLAGQQRVQSKTRGGRLAVKKKLKRNQV
jgi:hypothetical protein